MKKKIFALLLLILPFVFLTACSNQSELDGEYYWVRDIDEILVVKIDGEKATVYSEGVHSATVDKKMETFEVSGFMNPTVKYSYKDGILKANLSGIEREFYKKDSKAYDEAIKIRDNKLKEQELKENENKKQAESFSKSDELYEIVDYIDTASVTDGSLQKTTKRSGEYVASYVGFDGVQYEIVNEYKVKSPLDNKDYSKYYGCYISLKDGGVDLSTLSDNSVSELITDSVYFENMVRVEDKLKD
ncbi:hypothetical protein [Streptococcus suis]|uniref:hypothetical protein n=1 Tax=Streptococcus suis TaxID=1307 RepID=UPI0015D4760A|nr:hypothetical protein [Streptococcus suis]